MTTTSRAPARSRVTGPGRCAPNTAHVPAAWTDHALCAQVGGDAWFPEIGEPATRAKAICRRCPVRRECLECALDHRETFGVWGGLTTNERSDLRRDRLRLDVAS